MKAVHPFQEYELNKAVNYSRKGYYFLRYEHIGLREQMHVNMKALSQDVKTKKPCSTSCIMYNFGYRDTSFTSHCKL